MSHSLFSQLITVIKSHPDITPEQLHCKLKLQKDTLNDFVRYLESLGLPLTRNDQFDFVLINEIEPLNAEFIKEALSAWDVDVLPPFLTLESTNQYLKNTKSAFSQKNRLCLAEHQSRGRGRQSKTWVSPIAKNIILSLHTRLKISVADAGGLSLVAGISIVNALRELGIDDLKVKWPNDIFWQDKKLAGILIESTKLTEGCVELVVGIGLNMRMPIEEAKNIDQKWVDIAGLTDTLLSRNVVAAAIVNGLLTHYSTYEEHGLSAFLPLWRSMDYLYQKNISVNPAQSGHHAGLAIGINERGELLMHTGSKVVNLVAGDISVRKVS